MNQIGSIFEFKIKKKIKFQKGNSSLPPPQTTFHHHPLNTQWYMVLNKRVQWVSFDNILTNWFYNFSSIPNKSFCGLVVRRPAFHTEIRGSIPLAGSFVYFLVFFWFFSSFSKKGLSLGLCSSKANNTHW